MGARTGAISKADSNETAGSTRPFLALESVHSGVITKSKDRARCLSGNDGSGFENVVEIQIMVELQTARMAMMETDDNPSRLQHELLLDLTFQFYVVLMLLTALLT
jgi:hypothetical protein